MWRFVLTENIRRFQLLIASADSGRERDTLRQLLEEAESELAELEQVSTPRIAQRDAALKYFAEHAVDEAVKLNNAQFSTLQIYHEERKGMMVLAQRNFRAPFLHHLESIRPGDGSACGRCLQEGRQAAINDVNGEAGFEPHREAARQAGVEAVQATPVRNRSGEVIAVLSTYFTKPHVFSEGELERTAKFADFIGLGLEKYDYA